MNARVYSIDLEPLEGGGYFVSVPALPGCCTEGTSYEDALAMAEDAIKLWVETLRKNGEVVPEEPVPTGHAVVHLKVDLALTA